MEKEAEKIAKDKDFDLDSIRPRAANIARKYRFYFILFFAALHTVSVDGSEPFAGLRAGKFAIWTRQL